MQGHALTLGPGRKVSAWPDLDPSARALLLQETLAINPGLEPTGGVDINSALEPLFTDANGDLVTIDGQAAGNPLSVDVFPGQRTGIGLLILGLALVLLLTSRN